MMQNIGDNIFFGGQRSFLEISESARINYCFLQTNQEILAEILISVVSRYQSTGLAEVLQFKIGFVAQRLA